MVNIPGLTINPGATFVESSSQWAPLIVSVFEPTEVVDRGNDKYVNGFIRDGDIGNCRSNPHVAGN